MTSYPLTVETVDELMEELVAFQNDLRRPLTEEQIEEQLRDSGFGEACFDQMKERWFESFEAGRFASKPIERLIHHFGEARVRITPNEDDGATERKGVGITFWHVMLPPEGANTLVSTDEAFGIAMDLRRAAFQTEGQDPDKALMPALSQVIRWLAEQEHGEMYMAASEAAGKAPENIREMATALLLAIFQSPIGNDTTIPEMMHDLTNDLLDFDSGMRA